MQGGPVRFRQVESVLHLHGTTRTSGRLHGSALRVSCRKHTHTTNTHLNKRNVNTYKSSQTADGLLLISGTEHIDCLTQKNITFYSSDFCFIGSRQWGTSEEPEWRDLWQNSKWVHFKAQIYRRTLCFVLLRRPSLHPGNFLPFGC